MTAIFWVCVAMAVGAVYELAEWAAALALGQGDPWDTHSDMLLALIGAGAAVTLLLTRWHDRQLSEMRLSDGAIK